MQDKQGLVRIGEGLNSDVLWSAEGKGDLPAFKLHICFLSSRSEVLASNHDSA